MSKNKAISDNDLHLAYDEFLDETSGSVVIGNLEYSASEALRSVDPIAYRCGFADWLDAQVQDGIYFIFEDEYYTEEREERA